jgi:hypothetical protein
MTADSRSLSRAATGLLTVTPGDARAGPSR